MKNTVLIIMFCILLGTTGCENEDKKKRVVDKLNEDIKMESLVYDGLIFSITDGKKDGCIPVQLSVYDNGIYELHIAYASCRTGENCTAMLKYTKKETGSYHYDVLKIIQASTNIEDVSLSMNSLAEYEIFTGKGETYIIQNGTINPYLEEFLKQIHVDLKACAEPDYY